MSEDQFTKLFKYIEEFRIEVNQKLDEKASQKSVEALTRTVDGLVKRVETQEIENAARDLKSERLTGWAHKVSTKTGVPLKN